MPTKPKDTSAFMASPQDVLGIATKDVKVLKCNDRLAQTRDTRAGESVRTIKSVQMSIFRIEAFEFSAWPARLMEEPAVRPRLSRYSKARQYLPPFAIVLDLERLTVRSN
jgi:hypothetical protein